MPGNLNLLAFAQDVGLWTVTHGTQSGIFYYFVFGVYSVHQRFFMFEQYNLRTVLVTAPLLLLHLQFWRTTSAILSRAFDLGVQGRLFGR